MGLEGDLSCLLQLLDQKKSPDCPIHVQQHFYSTCCKFFRANPDCIWCRYTPLSIESLLLFSLPQNSFTELFSTLTKKCLNSCPNCITAYYSERPEFFSNLKENYEESALGTFRSKLESFDIERLQTTLQNFLNSNLQASDPTLLFVLYEILSYPQLLNNAGVNDLFCLSISNLLERKKMLRVTQVMPGIFCLAFHRNPLVRSWATSVLTQKLQQPAKFLPEAIKMRNLVSDAEKYLEPAIFWKSVALVLFWFPTVEAACDTSWISHLLDSLIFEIPDCFKFVSIFLSRRCSDDNFRKLRIISECDLLQKIFAHQKYISYFDQLAAPVDSWPADLTRLKREESIMYWIILVGRLGFIQNDTGLLKTLIDGLTNMYPLLGSEKAKDALLSLCINFAEECISTGLDRFYVVPVQKCLTFLLKLCSKTTPTSGQSLDRLGDILTTAIHFDIKDMESLLSNGLIKIGDLAEDSFPKMILSILEKNANDKTIFFKIAYFIGKLLVNIETDSEDTVFPFIIMNRFLYLTYLLKGWSRFGTADMFSDQLNLKLLLLSVGFAKDNSHSDLVKSLLKANPSNCIITMSSVIKSIGKISSFDTSPILSAYGSFLTNLFNPTIFTSPKTTIVDSHNIVLYLKIHILSFSSALLSRSSFLKFPDLQTEKRNAFFSVAETFILAFNTIGADALKQSLRENEGLSRRLRHVGLWLLYFCKQSPAIDDFMAKKLVPFPRICFQICLFLRIFPRGIEDCLQLYISRFSQYSFDLNELADQVKLYEKESGIPIKVVFPAKKIEPLALFTPLLHNNSSNIEDIFLNRLRTEATKDTHKPVRLSNIPGERSNDSSRPLISVPIAVKPASKLGQLKSDLEKEIQALPIRPAPVVKRQKNPVLNKTAKTVRLSAFKETSSDAESQDEHMEGFEKEISEIVQLQTIEPQIQRSVKLIPLESIGCNPMTRTKVDMDGFVPIDFSKKLQRYILELDFESLDDRNIEGSGAIVIPDSFDSPEHYLKVFEPLLLFECRSQLLQAKMELDSAFSLEMKVLSIACVDDFHEVTVACLKDENNKLAVENDCLMIKLNPNDNSSNVMGIVVKAIQNATKSEAIIRLLFKPHQSQLQIQLRIGLLWSAKKLCNWVTTAREYSALHSIQDLRLCKAILKPSFSLINMEACDEAATVLQDVLGLNHSQAKSVAVALNNPNPFTLIQGPPGTGKTRTIEGLIGAVFGRPFSDLQTAIKPQRVLICAPSNAAIDEIVRRLKGGIYDCYHTKFVPKVIRLGSHEMIHEEVKDITLDAVIERNFLSSCRDSLELLKKQKAIVADLKRDLDLAEEDQSQKDKIPSLRQSLWSAKENLKKNNIFIDNTRQTLRSKVLSETQVICTTLSSSGIELLSKTQFEFVIIDEACQAVEISALIPLQYGCKNCVLVGDPNQLPPTVISQAASLFAYEQSLFQRLQKASPDSVQLLSVQYRMHPSISVFPNRFFYGGRLTDGTGLEQSNCRSWHTTLELGPYKIFDIPGKEQNQVRKSGDQGTSKSNDLEVRCAVSLVAYICDSCPELNFAGKIGIVTPYKEQRRALRREFSKRFGHAILSSIEISTVDGYQGQEREIIIFSCVRTGECSGIGFLNDARRLNVALTRAKCSLFILGKSLTLTRNQLWRSLIEDAKDRNCFACFKEGFWHSLQRLRPKNLQAKAPNPRIHEPKREDEKRLAVIQPQKIKSPFQRREQESQAPEAKESSKKPKSFIDDLLDRVRQQ